ncbi:MAG: ribosome maturation factor RimM [Thiothrix sp.]|nr:ribosome maturation factor RimM [Thiothrix sp.]
MPADDDCMIVLGRIVGVYGVKGWVKIHSHTSPLDNILGYDIWHLSSGANVWQTRRLLDGKLQGKGLIARLENVGDRDAALALRGSEIAVERDELPVLSEGEYYWIDLIGMQVETLDGVRLGVIDYLFETGANDVMVVQGERERWIPWLMGSVIRSVSLAQRQVRVDWDPEF